MANEQQDVSPATAGGAPFPDEVRRRIWVAAEDLASTIGCTVVNAPPPLPPFKRRPVLKGSELTMDGDDEGNVWPNGVGWSLSWDCRLTFGRDEDTGEPTVVVNMSGEDLRRGITSRTAKRHQVAEFARLLAEQFGEPTGPDPRDAEIERLRGALASAQKQIVQFEQQRDTARAALAQHLADENSAQAANDRLRDELAQITDLVGVSAVQPGTVQSAVERYLFELDQRRGERDEARAERDRLLSEPDRFRWLCQALNVEPGSETWLTAMRRVRHLRQNFSDSPRCEVAESDGWRCRLFAGHDGKHLAQMPTGERREWPFDNRLTPRYWRADDPEPEIGTTVRYVNGTTWPTQTRRTDGQWHCDAGTHDPNTCTESELYSWEQLTARSELMPLVEVAANPKGGA